MSDYPVTFQTLLGAVTSGQVLPHPEDALLFPLLSQPSKITFRAYGPDSSSVWTAVLSLYATDLTIWDPVPIVQVTLSNVNSIAVSAPIPSVHAWFGLSSVITGTFGAAQTNSVVNLWATLERGW